MADGEKIPPFIKITPEMKKQLETLEKDIPRIENQIEALSDIVDVSPLREKIEWSKRVAKTLREKFT